jgi:hypothetical protein
MDLIDYQFAAQMLTYAFIALAQGYWLSAIIGILFIVLIQCSYLLPF